MLSPFGFVAYTHVKPILEASRHLINPSLGIFHESRRDPGLPKNHLPRAEAFRVLVVSQGGGSTRASSGFLGRTQCQKSVGCFAALELQGFTRAQQVIEQTFVNRTIYSPFGFLLK